MGGAQRASPKGPSPHTHPQMCGQATSEDWDTPSHPQAGQEQGRTWSPPEPVASRSSAPSRMGLLSVQQHSPGSPP